MNTYKIKVLGFDGTEEWMHKEYGSWEDHSKASNHVCAILQREMDKKFMEVTREELETLSKSINYHVSAGWDVADSPLQLASWHRTWNAYKKQIDKLLSDSAVR